MKRELFTILVGLLFIFSIVNADQISKKIKLASPLILLTQQDHSQITALNDINKIKQKLSKVKAFLIEPENHNDFLNSLSQYLDSKNIIKNKLSSIYANKDQIMNKISEYKFQDIQNIEQIKKAYQAKENILLYVQQKTIPRLLSEHESQPILTQTTDSPSSLFLNMTPATLTGLLVSLFLIVILLIAINCLYNVKTNDQFGRNHLWVGKQS